MHRFQDKCTFAFYAEIQDGRPKWRESDFGLKLPVDSSYTLRAKNFVEIALSHRFRDKCFYVSRRNSRWPPKVVGK